MKNEDYRDITLLDLQNNETIYQYLRRNGYSENYTKNLRKQKGLTQEELASKLFVSRTAVSKWESGKGYPNIESLKAIAGVFNISVDELLSGNEILNIAEQDGKRKAEH